MIEPPSLKTSKGLLTVKKGPFTFTSKVCVQMGLVASCERATVPAARVCEQNVDVTLFPFTMA